MMQFPNIRNRGFALLELLVVIAIIGILSAIVIASLNDSRRKSRNVSVVEQVHQYHKALELYYSNNGSYPSPGANPAHEICLADTGECWNGVFGASNARSVQVKTALAPYISSFPYTNQGVVGGVANSGSPAYNRCIGTTFGINSSCTPSDFSLFFLLEGTNEYCGGRSVQASANYGGGNHTLCRLMPK